MKNRVAIITGAASGMGKGVSEAFLQLGAKVVGFSMEEKCEIEHKNFTYIQGDIRLFECCKHVVDETIRLYGRVDALVNCAGIVKEGTLETTSVEEFKLMFDINTLGTFLMCKAAIPYLKKQPSTIVNISSDMSVQPLRERISYNPSKAAVNMLTKCIALDYAPMVRCNAILPGVIHTPMIQQRLDDATDPKELLAMYRSLYAMERIGNVDDIVKGVIFLSTQESAWITGIELPICGGPTA